MAPNWSIYTIPAYYILGFIPHVYGTKIISKANNGYFDNVNPHGVLTIESYKRLPKDVFTRYERAEAAHRNIMENMSLFVAAVILGNVAKIEPEILNTIVGGNLAIRVLYTVLYIRTTKAEYSYLRSLVWMSSVASLMYLVVKAGNALA
ncbi:hypothetical protein K432DRAFT_383901 [Lepidopterella palustris CBS 459.81]|uniref:Uncharacterized protein n=1 Tax=Lepidopterella palustris CBS 459.81 TaxID=1314670 RepID=A0A8E2JDD8_9PEZI|nr:hypothetical protein K432DRAFT_383901 [Lepidopterella palustris CBS 459.81]